MHAPVDEINIVFLPVGCCGVDLQTAGDQAIKKIRRRALAADDIAFFIFGHSRFAGDPLQFEPVQPLEDRDMLDEIKTGDE